MRGEPRRQDADDLEAPQAGVNHMLASPDSKWDLWGEPASLGA